MEKLSDHLYIPPMGDVLRERDAARKAAAKKPVRRNYAAARHTKANSTWTQTTYGANWTLYRDLRTLRARAREMAKNAGHFRRFLNMVERNVVGHKGLRLQCRAKFEASDRPNTNLNKRIEHEWWLWSFKENCSASGKLSLVDAQKLFIRHLIRDGEVLIEHVDADNGFGYALKFWNVDWLDETFNEVRPNGNRVIMSVEVDANDRPVGYWLTTPPSEINFTNRRERQRTFVSADRMSHAFLSTEDESQARGVTWFHAALLPGKGKAKYTEGVVNSATMAAMTGGFFKKTDSDETMFEGEENADGTEADLTVDFTELSFHELPDGYEFQQFDPKQPTQNHAEFAKSMLLDISAALDVCGFSLSGDMSAVNYSSARVGLGEERDVWRDLQTFEAGFLRVIFHKWLHACLLNGRLTLSAREYQQVQNPEFKPRGWRYVDPHKEIQANLDGITGGIVTVTSVLDDQGIDLEDFIDEKKREMEMFAAAGIPYPSKPEPASAKTPASDDDDEAKPPQDDGERAYTNGRYLS